MRHVTLDLVSLRIVEGAFANREVAHLIGRQERLGHAVEGQVRSLRPRFQLLEAPVRQNARLIGLKHDLEKPIQLPQLLAMRGLEVLHESFVSLLPIRLEEFRALAPELALGRAANERVAMAHQSQV